MNKNNQNGFAMLMVVVIIAASMLIMAYNASLFGMGESDLGFTNQKGGEALAVAEACNDEVLRRIRIDNNYGVGAGNINLSIGSNSCIINISANSSNRTIVITGTAGQFNKKIQTDITISGTNSDIITVNRWQERTD